MAKNFSPTAETHHMPASPRCTICSNSANVYRRKSDDVFEGFCEVCGDVSIRASAADKARNLGKAHLLSAWLRRHPPLPEPETIKVDDLERIFSQVPSYSVVEKLDLTLQRLGAATEQPGAVAKFSAIKDYPLIYAKNVEEAMFYL
ncbi:MAG: hypothetical protein ACHP78_08865, partial [Terriglobales bacterium]